jgi:23S rRNA pseudouridine1911/1915/1917 synthase
MNKYTVDESQAGKRLDVYLTETLDSLTRGAVKRAIKSELVTINGKPAKPHTALRADDEIELLTEIEPTPERAAEPEAQDIPLKIVHEDNDLLVIEKPTGMLVHPTVRNERDTLVAALLHHAPEISGVGDGPERPGIMQRLDKDASGLMVIAKNEAAYAQLKHQFMAHTIEKRYLILTDGRPPEDEGTIEMAIGRASDNRRMAARKEPLEGDRPAISHYTVARHLRASATLIEVRTETGRTHQIRAHFKAIGCPVAGDKLYGRRLNRLNAPRLFLHAAKLGFTHPTTGKRLEFESPLPPDLAETIERLAFTAQNED